MNDITIIVCNKLYVFVLLMVQPNLYTKCYKVLYKRIIPPSVLYRVLSVKYKSGHSTYSVHCNVCVLYPGLGSIMLYCTRMCIGKCGDKGTVVQKEKNLLKYELLSATDVLYCA